MTILLHPTKKCNFQCVHCFEPDDHRKAIDDGLNLDAVEKSLNELMAMDEHRNEHVGLHGGEPTFVPPDVFEKFVQLAEKYNRAREPRMPTGVVTNGSLITPELIKILKKHEMAVAVSIDGPPHLNLLRGPKPDDSEVQSRYNKNIMKTLRELRRAEIPTSIMCVINTINAGTPEAVDDLIDWLDMLAAMGITGGRINELESNSPHTDKYELSPDQLLYTYKRVFEWNSVNGYRYLPFREMVDNLLGYGNSPCSFGECNWYYTNTISILPDGTVTNCDRTFGEGEHTKSNNPRSLRIRSQVLQHTDCRGCKYWVVCYGGCPSEARDGDWRNKTKFCESIYGMYEHIEKQMKGLFPNIQLKFDPGFRDPFIRMSFAYNDKCSSWGGWTPRKQPQDHPQGSLPHVGQMGTRVPPELLPDDMDKSLPWRYAPGGYYADTATYPEDLR